MIPQGLKILEVYAFCDVPMFFLAQSKSGTKYLAYWCDVILDVNGKEIYGYLYTNITEELLIRLKNKAGSSLTVRDIYKRRKCVLFAAYGSEITFHIEEDFFPPNQLEIEYIMKPEDLPSANMAAFMGEDVSGKA